MDVTISPNPDMMLPLPFFVLLLCDAAEKNGLGQGAFIFTVTVGCTTYNACEAT